MDQKENINSYKLFSKLNLQDIYQNIARPVIIADNFRTPENMGSVLRLAANIGAEKVFFIKHDDEIPRSWKIKKTASGADEKTDWRFVTFDEVKQLIPGDYQYIAIETAESAVDLFKTSLPEKSAFIIGHEVYGIGEELMKIADKTVYIPVPGMISSLNVTHALGVVVFEWLRQRIL
jgi:tRNA G18 (ribose-2'-O)-methylase SpoU